MGRIVITEEQFKKILLSEQKVYSDFDGSYDYRVVNGKWQGKKKSGGNWFSLEKYPTSIKRLDDRYPNARKDKKTTTKTSSSAKKTTSVNKELDTPTKNQTGSKYLNLAKSRIGGDSWMMATVTESPFKNKAQGDAFRKWLNDTLPRTAKKLDVDPPSSKTSYKNKYIVNALNHVIPMKSGNKMTIYGYYTYKNPNWVNKNLKNTSDKDWDTKTELKRQKIEAGVIKVPEVVKNADRINKEVAFINAREEYNGKPFFIADPRLNLVVAFDEKHNYIAHSQSVAGADIQKPMSEKYTYKQWCEATNGARYIDIDNHKSDIKIEGCYKKGINIDDIADAESSKDKSKLKKLKPKMDYGVLEREKNRFAPAGIYKVSGVQYGKYTGDKNNVDAYMLKTKDGVKVGTAIHALVQSGDRIEADKILKKFLTDQLDSGEVPNEYIEMVEKDFLRKEETGGKKSKFDLSSGCFNVDPKFATNPKVQEIGKKMAYVFILSEKDVDYLVQVERGKEGDFLLDAGGKKEGFCKSPSQLTDDYGEMVA